MNFKERIEMNPEIMIGKPVIRGTRITVESILRKMSEGMNIESLIEAYPILKREDILAALSYSAEVIGSEEEIPLLGRG